MPPLGAQEELNLSKEAFRERYGENPRKEDLTILVPRQDDPTEQVGSVWLQPHA